MVALPETGQDQSQTTIDVNTPRFDMEDVTPDNLKATVTSQASLSHNFYYFFFFYQSKILV